MLTRFALAFGGLAALLSASAAVSAHEGREVGEYELNVGFLNEPAYEGGPNAALIRIAHHEDDEPVSGIEDNIKVEVTHMPTGMKKTFALTESRGAPGQYVANFIPTSPGTYVFRFTGDINGTKVDESFTSGAGTFDDVRPARELQFPLEVGSSREIEGAVRGVQASAVDAEDAAASARTLAIVGLVVGAAGLAVGGTSIAMRLRRN
jgi:hypothetical protein